MRTITFDELLGILRTADAMECDGVEAQLIVRTGGFMAVIPGGYALHFDEQDNPEIVCLGSTFTLTNTDGLSYDVTPLFEHQLYPSPNYLTRENAAYDGFVTGVVSVQICEMLEINLEGFLDLISERLVGSELLYAVDYKIVGYRDQTELLLQVSGRLEKVSEL